MERWISRSQSDTSALYRVLAAKRAGEWPRNGKDKANKREGQKGDRGEGRKDKNKGKDGERTVTYSLRMRPLRRRRDAFFSSDLRRGSANNNDHSRI